MVINHDLRIGNHISPQLIVTRDGKMAIGTNNLEAKFNVFESQKLGANKNDYSLIATISGEACSNSTNVFKNRLFLRRKTNGTDWLSAVFHDAISIDRTLHNNPGINTRTWWERDPGSNIQSWGHEANEYMQLKGSGATCTLKVAGTFVANSIEVKTNVWSDFVFSENYKLPSLSEVKAHIEEHKTLPDIPSEAEVKENGIDVGAMQAKLLQKIEELTLYTIQQQELIENLVQKIEKLERQQQIEND
jgi:hypothetical protein